MEAGHDGVGTATALARRFAGIAAESRPTAKRPMADLIAAMPIVMLVRAVREALAERARRDASLPRRTVDAG